MGEYLGLDSQRGLLKICSTISGADFLILDGFSCVGSTSTEKTVHHSPATPEERASNASRQMLVDPGAEARFCQELPMDS